MNSMDTAKDARILILEDALRRLTEVVNNRKLKFHVDYSSLIEQLKTAGSLIYEVKYSYQPASQLAESEPTLNLIKAINQFEEIFTKALSSAAYSPKSLKEKLVLADIRYSFIVTNRFLDKLKNSDDDPAHAIDVLALEITEIDFIEGSKNLSECRCTDGKRIWPIVTNIQGLKKGTKLAAGILPPVEMMGVVSEAMFLGSAPLSESTNLGILVDLPEPIKNQARAQALQITKRMA